MSSWVKALIVLALVVPMTAYVAGSLVSSSARAPADRGPVIINDSSEPPTPVTPGESKQPTQPTPPDDGSTRIDDNEARVVTPQPTAVDDSDGDDEDDEADDRREGDDDDSRTGDDTDDGDD